MRFYMISERAIHLVFFFFSSERCNLIFHYLVVFDEENNNSWIWLYPKRVRQRLISRAPVDFKDARLIASINHALQWRSLQIIKVISSYCIWIEARRLVIPIRMYWDMFTCLLKPLDQISIMYSEIWRYQPHRIYFSEP